MEKNERLLHMTKVYDDLEHSEHYFSCENSKNFRDKISHQQFLTVFSDLDFFFSKKNRPVALDIGCSSGRYTKGLKEIGMYAIGTDVALIPLKYASERIDTDFIRSSTVNLPFKKAKFDLVICIELLHHFEDNVLERVLEEISRVVKPGGMFIFDIKNKLNPLLWYKYKKEDRIEFTLKARTISRMIKLTEKYGFEVIKKKSILSPIILFSPYLIVFVRKVG